LPRRLESAQSREEQTMTETTWTWARLDRAGLDLVQETERTLGADVVLVYAEGGPVAPAATRAGLRPAALDESQLECLRGVEAKVGGIAVAYQRA
jgi:hypothetical protein